MCLYPLQVLETGFNYNYYSLKGLELQETSCHTAEASKVDGVFSRAFDTSHESSKWHEKIFNQNLIHTLHPVTKVPVLAYSDTKNVLTGVIDSGEFLTAVPDYFRKCLLYLLLEHIILKSNKSINQMRNQVDTLNSRPQTTTSRRPSQQIKSPPHGHLEYLPSLNNETDAIVLERRSGTASDVQSSNSISLSREGVLRRTPSVEVNDTRSVSVITAVIYRGQRCIV